MHVQNEFPDLFTHSVHLHVYVGKPFTLPSCIEYGSLLVTQGGPHASLLSLVSLLQLLAHPGTP